MFDIGWTEIIIVVIVSCLALDFKDLPKIVKGIKQAIKYANELFLEVKQVFTELEQETKKIIDLEGNEQITYDLDDITPDIKVTKDEPKK